MDCFIYSVEENNEEFEIIFKLAKYIQENREEIVWGGGFYPRFKDTNYRGQKAFRQILSCIGMTDIRGCSKFLKLLRHEYFCEGDWIKTSRKELAEDMFSDNKGVYIGKDEKVRVDNSFDELINVIDEMSLDSDEWKDVIHHILLKL